MVLGVNGIPIVIAKIRKNNFNVIVIFASYISAIQTVMIIKSGLGLSLPDSICIGFFVIWLGLMCLAFSKKDLDQKLRQWKERRKKHHDL